MPYIIDSSVLLTAHRSMYFAEDICPDFWKWILSKHASGDFFATDTVKSELLAGDPADPVHAWAAGAPTTFFKTPPANIASIQKDLTKWVAGQVAANRYEAAAQASFLKSNDYKIISYCGALGYTMVTRERGSNKDKKQVKMPDACRGIGVAVVNEIEILKQLNYSVWLTDPAGARP